VAGDHHVPVAGDHHVPVAGDHHELFMYVVVYS
jgi:hypothetical protein